MLSAHFWGEPKPKRELTRREAAELVEEAQEADESSDEDDLQH